MMNKTLALEIVGGLSTPSKMPCYGFSIPAKRCITGMKLREVEGSVCSKCYALKGRYAFGVVKDALERRFERLSNPLWVKAMAWLIKNLEKSGYFRWHDSGDLQSVEHFNNIVKVCKLTPNVQHWLPTREYSIIGQWTLKYGRLPANLTVRLSSLMLEAMPPTAIAQRYGVTTSGVTKDGFTCPSSNQDGKCNDCRACWNKQVANVNYKQH